MKATLLILVLSTFILLACSEKEKAKEETKTIAQPLKPTEEKFKELKDFPLIKDSAQFIVNLVHVYKIDFEESPVQEKSDKITFFKKVKLYGSDQEYYFIEYDWIAGSMANVPWRTQLLLSTNGNLIKTLSANRFDFVTIFPNENPFLLITIVTGKGNGGHHIYKVSADTLENVYEGYYNYEVRTVDEHEDIDLFEPSELNTQFTDANKDGFNDIIFSGTRLILGKWTKDSIYYDVENGVPFSPDNPATKIPITYVFLYDKKSGHFKAKEDYSHANGY